MANRTQCPNCLSVFAITDEQYRKSGGKVRCGSCRQPFQASFLAHESLSADSLSLETPESLQSETKGSNSTQSSQTAADKSERNKQYFEDMTPSAETSPHSSMAWPAPSKPLSEILEEQRSMDAFLEDLDSELTVEYDSEISFSQDAEEDEPTSFFEQTPSFFEEPLSEISVETLKRSSSEAMEQVDAFEEKVRSSRFSDSQFSEEFSSVTTRSYWDETLVIQEEEAEVPQEEDLIEQDDNDSYDGEIGHEESSSESAVASHSEPSSTVSNYENEQELISTVDQLIEEKIAKKKQPPYFEEASNSFLSANSESESEEQSIDSDVDDTPAFSLDQKPPSSVVARWLLRPALVILSTLLILVLILQLWYRQAIPFVNDNDVSAVVLPVIEPLKVRIEDTLGVVIPTRRDLAGLHLLSAQTESHPTRASTQLLKVTIVNRSSIAQSYPWLEFLLSDEAGRLISRRSLAPSDYLHNNRLTNQIGAKEQRTVTIELLSFPKQAHGYEVRLLNKQ